MVVSTCLPVHYEDELVGVTCIDLVLADLLGTIDSFVHGEHSYAFVIDATGRTLVHPLLPQVISSTWLGRRSSHPPLIRHSADHLYICITKVCTHYVANALSRPIPIIGFV